MTAPIAAIDLPPDPPAGGSEAETLFAFLDYYRAVIIRKCAGPSTEQLRTPLASSDLTLVGLLKHLALVEDSWFDHRVAGQPPREPWAGADWDADPDWELTSAVTDDPPEVLALYEAACARSRAACAGRALEDPVAVPDERRPGLDLRWVLVHLIEEYARHAGHADLLRQALDGATGD